jgi:hypothetical protein
VHESIRRAIRREQREMAEAVEKLITLAMQGQIYKQLESGAGIAGAADMVLELACKVGLTLPRIKQEGSKE